MGSLTLGRLPLIVTVVVFSLCRPLFLVAWIGPVSLSLVRPSSTLSTVSTVARLIYSTPARRESEFRAVRIGGIEAFEPTSKTTNTILEN